MQRSRKSDRHAGPAGLKFDGVQPHFRADGVALYQGDVLQLGPQLPSARFNAVITDPPYCSGGTTSAERKRDPVSKYCQSDNACGRPTFSGDTRDQRSFSWWCAQWLLLCRQATVDSGYLLVFIDWRQLPTMTDAVQAAGWTWRGIAPWNKGRGARAPPPGGEILDPFAGSCTTGVASILNGRRFTGFELSADYCDLGADRLKAALRGELLLRDAA